MTTQKLLKSLACASLMLFTGTMAWAQVGIKAGINMASLSRDAGEDTFEEYEEKSILGFQAGLTFELPIAGPLAIQPEFLFVQKGGKSEFAVNSDNKGKASVVYNYLEIPLLLKLKFGSTDGEGAAFYLIGGPYAGYVISGKAKQELTVLGQTTESEQKIDYDDDDFDDEGRLDWGTTFGAGVHLGRMFIDARYNLGINNILDNDDDNGTNDDPFLRTRGIGLTLGFVL